MRGHGDDEKRIHKEIHKAKPDADTNVCHSKAATENV